MKAVIVLLLLSTQGAFAAWDIRDCADNVKAKHGIRKEVAMEICADSQAKQKEQRQCVIGKVKNEGLTPDAALNQCIGARRSAQVDQSSGAVATR